MKRIDKVITFAMLGYRYARVIYTSGKVMTFRQGCIPENVLHFMRNANKAVIPGASLDKTQYEYTKPAQLTV